MNGEMIRSVKTKSAKIAVLQRMCADCRIPQHFKPDQSTYKLNRGDPFYSHVRFELTAKLVTCSVILYCETLRYSKYTSLLL